MPGSMPDATNQPGAPIQRPVGQPTDPNQPGPANRTRVPHGYPNPQGPFVGPHGKGYAMPGRDMPYPPMHRYGFAPKSLRTSGLGHSLDRAMLCPTIHPCHLMTQEKMDQFFLQVPKVPCVLQEIQEIRISTHQEGLALLGVLFCGFGNVCFCSNNYPMGGNGYYPQMYRNRSMYHGDVHMPPDMGDDGPDHGRRMPASPMDWPAGPGQGMPNPGMQGGPGGPNQPNTPGGGVNTPAGSSGGPGSNVTMPQSPAPGTPVGNPGSNPTTVSKIPPMITHQFRLKRKIQLMREILMLR